MNAPNPTSSNLVSGAMGGRWLRPMRADWPLALCRLLDRSNSAVVRVVVAQVKGSAPRECGACMLVSREGIQGTIGGGHLEWEATRAAHELLADSEAPAARIWSVILGRELSQCCGGAVELWLERFTRADLPLLRSASRALASGDAPVVIASELTASRVTRRLLRDDMRLPGVGPQQVRGCQQVRAHFSQEPGGGRALLTERLDVTAPALRLYGAGHVGQALIRAISDLPFEVTWIDPRCELLPDDLPDNIHALHAPEPIDTVSTAPASAFYLVMTHDHALDYSLCRAILGRGAFAWLGLIGSRSKGAKFRSRLARDGIANEMIARLVCPIGVGGVESKLPSAIAIAVAAQLLQMLDVVVGSRAPAGLEPELAPGPGAESASCSSADCRQCSTHRGRNP
jgi:xanthine dehydrogenase accessory factor